MITFATDLYAPVIRATKTVANLTHPDGPTRAGDRLRYTVTFANEGLEAATNFVATDKIPPDTTYVAGSLRIPTAPASAATPSDLVGDDQGEFDAAQNSVRFFLGSGAAAGVGGALAVAGTPGDTAQVSFEVRVDDDLTAEQEIRNVAQATFIAPTLGKELTALSSETLVTATPSPTQSEPADLALAQSETEAPAAFGDDSVDDHVTIDNSGPGDATDVVLHDVAPPGATIDSATIDQGSCSVSATDVTCVIPHLDAGGSAEADIVLVEPPGDALAGSKSEASISASQFDPTPSNDSGEATAPMSTPGAPMADLVIQDHESSSQDTLGGTLVDTITVVDNGPGEATGIDLTDALDAAAQVTAIDSGRVHVQLRSGRPMQPGRAGAGRERDPGGARATAPSGRADRRCHRERRPVRSELRQRFRADDRHRHAQRHRGKGPDRPRSTGRGAGACGRIRGHCRRGQAGPGVKPTVCVTLPRQLRVVRAAGAVASAGRLCWDSDALVNGSPRTFRFSARVVSSGATTIAVQARLTGANFAASRAAATVAVPPRTVVACPSSSGLGRPGPDCL